MPTLSTHAVLILVGAGLIGGAGNAVAGGGSLATFPVLIGLGLPPIIANVTNTLGHVPGYVAIVAGLREELTGQQRRVALLTPLAAAGAALGAVLLSLTPPNGFRIAAPFLVLFACALIAVRPRLVGHLTARQGRSAPGPLAVTGIVAGCAYAGYFGAGAGFITLATLSLVIADNMQTLNALSRICICVANVVALPILLWLNPVDLAAAATLWPSTLIGGYLGARATRRLPESVLRLLVVALGRAGAGYLLLT